MRFGLAHAIAGRLQKVLFDKVMNPDTPVEHLAALARAWDVLEERRRIIAMKPKPRDLDTTINPTKSIRLKAIPLIEAPRESLVNRRVPVSSGQNTPTSSVPPSNSVTTNPADSISH